MVSSSGDRLVRLLNLVPFLQTNREISLAETAKLLGITEKQLVKDLHQLWLCGLPGYGPGDLIDFYFDDNQVSVVFNAGVTRPLRLTYSESITLLFSLKSLTNLQGLVEPELIKSIQTKLVDNILGDNSKKMASLTPSLPNTNLEVDLFESIKKRRLLVIDYYSVTSNTYSTRKILPLSIVVENSQAYLYAWCFTAKDYRFFRLSRINKITIDGTYQGKQKFNTDPNIPLKLSSPTKTATLGLESGANWIVDLPNVTKLKTVDKFTMVEFKYYSLAWLARFIRSNMPHIIPVEPKELVDSLTNFTESF